VKLKITGLVISTIALTIGWAGQAQADSYDSEFKKAFSANSGDIYENGSIGKQVTTLFGLSYSDLEYRQDAQALNTLYREGMRRQVGVPVATQDLASPFNTSIQTNPGLAGVNR
jgi:hypothetical protein